MSGLLAGKKPFVVQAATGAGKSLIIAGICRRLDPAKVLILQPSKEILEQNFSKLISYDPMIDAGMYSASVGRKEIRQFTFATIGSIDKHPELFKDFDYAIIDECHGVNPKNFNGQYNRFFRAAGITKIMGLTATPYRLDIVYEKVWEGKNLFLNGTAAIKMLNRITATPFFKSIDYKIETAELIERGYLAPIKYFVEPTDWSELKVNTTGADFTTASAEAWARKRADRILQALAYADAHHQRSLTFCGSIEQAEEVQADLQSLSGIKAEVVTGTTPKKERERLIAEYKAGRFKHMLNVGVFTTGFDMPILDCVILARPTMSLSLYYQMVGRGVRTDPDNPNKILHVYDIAGVVKRLGRVETIRVVKEKGGFRDEVHSEVGRMDGKALYSFVIEPTAKKEED